MKSVFSIDVEDWFNLLNVPTAPRIEEWDLLPSIVEKDFLKLLDILDSFNVKATCFFLGYVAKRFPHLVSEAKRKGNEVASHGFYHLPVDKMQPREFYDDLQNCKSLLEDVSGDSVIGFRAPAFTVTKDNPWFFDVLAEAGFMYDSSVFPASRFFVGGMKEANLSPFRLDLSNGTIVEFPISVVKIFGFRICFFGGGYLRLFPYWMIKHFSKKVEAESRPIVFYVHPREIDPKHPRLKTSLLRSFLNYYNIKSTERKIMNILKDFNFVTFNELLTEYLG